jgi:hypothetical protein
MQLTALGAHTAMLGPRERLVNANNLMDGREDVMLYIGGFAICYDAAAYVRYLLGPNITPHDLLHTEGQNWVRKFFPDRRTPWNGTIPLTRGTAVGFSRVFQGKEEPPNPGYCGFFHAAIATGLWTIRAIKGATLGDGWKQEVRLPGTVLTDYDAINGTFRCKEGPILRVYLSSL